MKTRWILAVLLAAVIAVGGCKKKSEPAPPVVETDVPAAAPAENEAPEPVVQAPAEPAEIVDVVETAVETVTETAQETTSQFITNFTSEVDLEKKVSDLKIEAAKMSVDDLRAVAMKYKKAFEEKKFDLDAAMKKMQEMSATEKMGTEGQALINEIKTLNESLIPLGDRLKVYLDAIKKQNGDISDLKIG